MVTKLKTTPVKGAFDYSPKEAKIRDYLQDTILQVYRKYGFERIITPAIEDSENLDKSEGGDNLNLIFKILKRGDKLKAALDLKDENELSDMGLRYDLTLPLCRYVANNRGKIVLPFKVIQIGNVYRAERPQKGRLREFIQCDIDVIGSSSANTEVELLFVISEALTTIGLKNFTIKVNDRRVLKALLKSLGFKEEELDSVCISFDKLDKVGPEGVKDEIIEKGYSENGANKLYEMLNKGRLTLDDMDAFIEDKEVLIRLKYIVEETGKIIDGNIPRDKNVKVEFEPSLVRGQGYYTGTVFEVVSEDFKGSITGGGRYDNLIGKFIKEDIPAVGISIGFERIFSILLDEGFEIPNRKEKIAYIYSPENFNEAFQRAQNLRDKYEITLTEKPKKMGPYLDKLKEIGFVGFINMDQGDEVSYLK